MIDQATATDDAELAAQLAHTAGRIAREIRAAGLMEGRALGDAADRTANRFLCDALHRLRPDDGLLSEERRDTADRLNKDRVWIVDPVDGTREYGEARSDWAVHVALAIDGAPAVGAVALPDLELVLRSDRPTPLPDPVITPRLVVSRSRPAPEAVAVAERIGGTLVEMGSAGAKAMAVVRGEAEIYLHSGGQHQWDNCAPAAVAHAHGLHCSRIDGAALIYNEADVSLPDLLICRPEYAERVLEIVASLGS